MYQELRFEQILETLWAFKCKVEAGKERDGNFKDLIHTYKIYTHILSKTKVNMCENLNKNGV